MGRFSKLLCLLLALAIFWGCEKQPSGTEQREIAVPTAVVNLRTGPGTSHGIVKGLTPKDTTYIISGQGEKWLYVKCSGSHHEGYVSSKYMEISKTSVSTPDPKSSTAYNKSVASASFFGSPINDGNGSGSLLKAWPRFILNSGWPGLITVFLLLGLSVGICTWLKKRYNYQIELRLYKTYPAAPAYAVVFISMALTLWQILAIFSVRDGASDNDFIYSLMIISTGIPMATIPWRIRISSLWTIRDRSESGRYVWGGRIGVLGWIILLFPLCIFYLQSASYNDLNMKSDSFSGMLFTLGFFFGISWVFARFFWPLVIVKYLFKSMNSTLLGILNVVLVLGIGIYGFKMCDQTFSGLTYVVSLWALWLIMMVILMAPINVINERRCGNCHNFEGQYEGSTDLGSSYETDTDWESTSDSNITARHSGAIISDARRKVRTTTRIDKWKTHHSCPYCYEEWDLDHENRTEVGRETLERRWTETY